MRSPTVHLFCGLLICSTLPGMAQAPSHSTPAKRDEAQPLPTFHAYSRVVVLDAEVTDAQGKHVTGLKPEDFQLFEQYPSQGNKKSEQKIAAFREVRVSDLPQNPEVSIPAGVFTNLITLQKNPVPPTILLVDGLNTPLQYQAQVHLQMMQMLSKLPNNLPIAVFLLGNRLQMVQDFTTDPRMLQSALNSSMSTAGEGMAKVDPRDDSTTLSARQENSGIPFSPELIEAAKEFEQKGYAQTMDERVRRTIETLTSLAHHVSGYPGRKNLLWFSSAFPIALSPVEGMGALADSFAGMRDYGAQLKKLDAALNTARLAVYPIDPAGVQGAGVYQAGTIPRDPKGPDGKTIGRDVAMQFNERSTMNEVAESTGGKVCTENDLGECVRKAIDDSSDYYEIAWYPDSKKWNGEYRKIILQTRKKGLQLAYRQGYYATTEGGGKPNRDQADLQAACRDPLNATGVFFAVRSLPSKSADRLNFGLTINVSALTFVPMTDGGQEMNVDVAICNYDKKDSPLQLLRYPDDRKLTLSQYDALISLGGLRETIFVPGKRPAAVRFVVEDIASGRIGSVYMNIGDPNAAAPAIQSGTGSR